MVFNLICGIKPVSHPNSLNQDDVLRNLGGEIMSKKSSSTTGLTRRGFLKTTGVAAGALGLAGATGMTTSDPWLSTAIAQNDGEERKAVVYHQSHCGGDCSFLCSVRDGRLCNMEPNPAIKDHVFRTCCLKGLSEVQHVYSDARIQSPMKLVGERGSGEYVPITWDEAMDIFVSRLEEVWSKTGKESVYVHTSAEAGRQGFFLPSLLGASTGGASGIDNGIGNGLDPAYGSQKGTTNSAGAANSGSGYAAMTNDVRDMTNSDFILNVGCNYLETSLPHAARFFEAKDAGARIVTVDPHFSTTAQKSDEWIPIEPGYDLAMFLGMITHILDNKLYNRDFILARTAYPFLIDLETGKQLRIGETKLDEKTGKALDPGDFMVWDSISESAVRHDTAGSVPALEGTFEVDGRKYTTVFSQLIENQKEYTLEWASEKCAIPAEKIIELAESYANAEAAGIMTGWGGVDKMSNADADGRAIACLVGLTGQIGRPGAFVGNGWAGWSYMTAGLAGWKMSPSLKPAKAPMAPFLFPVEDNNIRSYIACGDTVSMKIGNMNQTIDWLHSLDFVVAMDIYFTPVCHHSDLILPVSSKFESEEEFNKVAVQWGYVRMSQKAIDPLFESKSDFYVQKTIAKALGLESELPESATELIKYRLENATDPALEGITFESVVENGYAQPLIFMDTVNIGYVEKFGTASEKLEVYHDNMVEYGHSLPVWEENLEVYRESPLKEKYPLQFLQRRVKDKLHNQFWSASWINELYEYAAQMNSIDMEARGLVSGDKIELFNDRGNMICKVAADESIRPGVVRVVEGVWNELVEGDGFQNMTNNTMLDRSTKLKTGAGAIPFNDTLCEVRKA